MIAMAAAGEPPPTAESVLRGACAATAAAAALLLGLSAQTKTVLFVRKKAVARDVQALWVLIAVAAAAAAYHVAQLARCLYTGRLAAASRGVACASFLLDKVRTTDLHFAGHRS